MPEVSVTLPWLSAGDFEQVVHRAAEGSGFSFESDLERRPDIILGERDIGLDRAQTRRRLLLGIGLGIGGILVIALIFAVLLPTSASFVVIVLTEFVGAAAAVSGLTIGTESRWESDLLRVRLDPATTRSTGRISSPGGRSDPLSVKVFIGRVTSSSTSTKAGTYRSLRKVLPPLAASTESAEFASKIAHVARTWTPAPPRAVPLVTSPTIARHRPRSPNLVPLVSKSGRPEWNDFPGWFRWVRLVALMVPMILLMAGAFAVLLPWNYQRVDFTPGGPSTLSLSGEPWSPTGATSGELYWYTYNPAIAADVNNVPVRVALCPVGTTTIDPSSCRAAVGGSLVPLNYDDVTISIPAGWHVVASLNASQICAGCHTSVRFNTPETALGIELLIPGVGVLVAIVIIWQRTRVRAKSAWPE